MKFLPVKEGNMAMLMRLPVRRLSLKAYIEKSMIPDIIEHEGSEFLSSLFWARPHKSAEVPHFPEQSVLAAAEKSEKQILYCADANLPDHCLSFPEPHVRQE